MKHSGKNGVKLPKDRKQAQAILDAEQEREWQEADDRKATTKKLVVEVDAFNWGLLNAGALINGCTPEEALAAFLNTGDELNEWWNQGCPLNLEGKGL